MPFQMTGRLLGRVAGPLVVAAVASSACSRDSQSGVGRVTAAILGGTVAASGDFPELVAIDVAGTKLCSGVLITPRKVLSAAHCVDPVGFGLQDLSAVASVTSVYVGITDFTAAHGVGIGVADIDLHPSYTGVKVHDLALIELKLPVEITPAPVNVDASLDSTNTTLTLVGYGVSSAPGGTPDQSSSGVLRSVTSRSKSCASIALDRTASLCFDLSSASGSCFDDGGPSFLEVGGTRVVAGIHSFTDPSCNQFSLDTRVDQELGFIGPSLCGIDGYCAAMCGTAPLDADPDCIASFDAGAANDAAIAAGGRGGASGAEDSSVAGNTGAGEDASPAAASGGATAGASGDAGSTPVSMRGSQSGSAGMNAASTPTGGGGCGCRIAPNTAHRGAGSYAALATICFALARRRRRVQRRSRGFVKARSR